jgi:hypothetical protein
MSATTPRGGSGVSARSITPSLQLAKLAGLLAKSLEDPAASSGALPLLSCVEGRVAVNTRGVLGHLFANPEFASSFTAGPNTGFVRDIELPPFGTDARVGGRMLAGSQQETAKAINRMVDAIEKCIEQVVPADVQLGLSQHTVDEAIGAIAANFGVSTPKQPGDAKVVPVAFANNDRKVAAKDGDVARMFSAIETLDGGDGLERFITGVSNYLQKQGSDDDDIAAIAQSLRTRAAQPGDTVNRFLQFLEDEALARVRLQVSIRLMAALADYSAKAGFKAYVARVIECFEQFAGPRGSSLLLDVSAGYGQKSNVNLSDSLRRAGFYICLPVWPEWAVQMFEARPDPTASSGATVREVSYRFRVNGNNPEFGQPAFDVRLKRHEARLTDVERGDQSVSRQIADLVFLWLVVPDSIDHTTDIDVVGQAKGVAEKLKANPAAVLKMVIGDLRARSDVMKKLATELVDLITDKAHRVLSAAESTADRFRVSISRAIVDLEAFASYSDKSELLRRSSTTQDNIEWLKHLTVGEDVLPPNSLVSFVVRTDLQERSLVSVGAPRAIAVEHDLSGKVLPVRFAPYKLDKQHGWLPIPLTDGALEPGFGIEVQYDGATLGKRRDLKDAELSSHEQRRAAAISAFTALVYVTIWLISRKARASCPDVSTLILRVARDGKRPDREDDAASPSTTLYAISHAMEKALAREGNVKLQGYTAAGDDVTRDYRKRGAVAALGGGQTLSFNLDGSLGRVALVTYVTRPCDAHPSSPEPDVFLFTCRTYVAEQEGSSAKLKVARMRSRVIGTRDDLGDAQPVLTELSWLAAQGYEHVMLLSHHFGNRHLGRAAERHAPHGSLEFLDDAHQRFPQMRFYTLRRDVFPATRLRRRTSAESAFEVVTFADHQQLYERHARDLFRGVMPVYTFATLNVVGRDDNRPQSGFCTYFFDVDHRMNDLAWQEATKADMLGFGGDGGVRASLISVLRAIHFMESERQGSSVFLPVLDPFDWATPIHRAATGEVEIMRRRRKGEVLLSLPAVLSHITEVLKIRFPEEKA